MKTYEAGKATIYYDDLEDEKLKAFTISELVEGATIEAIESVVSAVASLASMPVAHTLVSRIERLAA